MANEQSDERLRVVVDYGKYTYIMRGDGSSHALRYGEPWIDSFTQVPGSGMILTLAHELDAARAKIARLEATLADATRAEAARLRIALDIAGVTP